MEPRENGPQEVNKSAEGFGQGSMNPAPVPVADNQGKKKRSKATVVLVIIAILALGAAGAFGYLFYGTQTTLKNADQTIETLFNENADLKQQANQGVKNNQDPNDPVSSDSDETLIKAEVTRHMQASVSIGDDSEIEATIVKTNGKFAQVSAKVVGQNGGRGYTLKKVNDSWVIIHHGTQGPFEGERDAYGIPEGYYVESE